MTPYEKTSDLSNYTPTPNSLFCKRETNRASGTPMCYSEQTRKQVIFEFQSYNIQPTKQDACDELG
ncbi:hypothetical protein Hanom_Chr10g00963131 [Helianthus anomalus]